LDDGLRGTPLGVLPSRTRSKKVKSYVCEVLGYPAPPKFTKTQPQFPGQLFDTHTQKSNNLQIWNQELSASRRYVLIRASEDGIITRVKVVTGDALALLDTTGKLTKKYQAGCIPSAQTTELISAQDTARLLPFVSSNIDLSRCATPVLHPEMGQILPIEELFARLSTLVGKRFPDPGADQERNRGAALHRLVCKTLGYPSYQDNGQFPDIRHQLLEVKLQTSRTIDLGLVTPKSVEPLDVPMICRTQIRHCDVRYGIFYGEVAEGMIELTHFLMTTGADFFTRFPQFQGKVLNAKLQIHLPIDFFDT
jgi:hypothetical protein